MGRPLLDDSRVASFLNHIPVLDQNPVLDSHNVRRNPVHRQSEVRKSPVQDDKLPFASVKFLSPIEPTCQSKLSEYLKWQPGSAVTTAATSTWAIFGAGLTWN